MLKIRKLDTGYGKKQVLFGLSMEVPENEIVAMIGPNGAGKSTVLKAIFGLIPTWNGKTYFRNISITGATPAGNTARGIIFVPQDNRVFNDLTIKENLEVGGLRLSRKELREHIEKVWKIFPMLRERSSMNAGRLSGGEQQMVALARALVQKPKLLMLDEPSLGLAPSLIKTVFNKIVEINQEAKVTILMVEQKVREVLDICNHVYSFKLGKVSFSGHPDELRNNKEKLKQLFL